MAWSGRLVALATITGGALLLPEARAQCDPIFPVPLTESGANTPRIVVCDLDGDGNLDVLLGDRDDAHLVVLAGDGLGGLAAPVSHAVIGELVDFAASDLDGDGIPDAVVGADENGVQVLLGDGLGGLGPPQLFAAPDGIMDVAVGHLDHDGVPDVVATSWGSSPTQLLTLRGDGSGGLLPPAAVDAGLLPSELVLGDLNGDGLDDAVTATSYFGGFEISVHLADGAGGLGPAVLLPGPFNIYALALADLDLDDDLDLLVRTTTALHVQLGDGAGGFGPPVQVLTPFFDITASIAVGDIDRDGVLDVGIPTGRGLSVLPGDGLGGFGPDQPCRGLADTAYAVLADMNGDGWLDAVCSGGHPDRQITVLRGDGQGGLVGSRLSETNPVPLDLALGDLDGDGAPDVVTVHGSFSSPGVSVLLAEDSGGFGPAVEYPGGSRPDRVQLGDLDGDGDLDAVVSSLEAGEMRVLYGDGLGGLDPPTSYADPTAPTAIALGDVDGNGRLDVLCSDGGADEVAVWLAQDGGGLHPAAHFPTGFLPRSLALGDVDDDGAVDVVTANFASDDATLLRGDGLGGFGPPESTWLGDGPEYVRLDDLDADGALDLVALTTFDRELVLWRGVGSGSFETPRTLAVGEDPRGLALRDVNADGRTDLVSVFRESEDVYVHLAEDARTYAAPLRHGLSDSPRGLAVGDLDGDGLPELATALLPALMYPPSVGVFPNGADVSWSCLGHQLPGTHGTPRLEAAGSLEPGQPVELQLFNGLEAAPTVLALALARLDASFKGGVLVPDPASGVLLSLVTDGDGRIALQDTWPGDVPAGLELFAQYWIHDPAGPVGFAASNAVSGATP